MNNPTIYLIPNLLGETSIEKVLPKEVKLCIEKINYFFVENEKNARAFIKKALPEKKQSDLILYTLNKHSNDVEIENQFKECLKEKYVGVISDAGCPAIADPGSKIVAFAHQHKLKIVPVVGPNSILLALMSSGLNGQNFAFNGYLPINSDKKKNAINFFEKKSNQEQQTQIFIETPYRNNQLFSTFLEILHPSTMLCVAVNLTLKQEFILTQNVKQWKKEKIDLHKQPAIFLFHKY